VKEKKVGDRYYDDILSLRDWTVEEELTKCVGVRVLQLCMKGYVQLRYEAEVLLSRNWDFDKRVGATNI
jgi:hypothetical protein